ncbi:MAG TPA: acyltransferase domain-containing protein, partial [Actinomycetota bacterium]|nr:acyltransferase domain-containing protein [Actinomycetota bacterium]
MKSAVLFPGQGSQYAGMADPWVDHPEAAAMLAESSEVLGYDVVEACRDEKQLADTAVVQPALFACDLAAFRVAEAEGRLLAGELDERFTPLDLANLPQGVCVA